MKQILQNISNGETQLVEVPCPHNMSGQLLISTTKSLVSLGTERMLVDFGRSGWIEKARSHPDKVQMVFDKIKTDGLMPTIDTVRSKLDQPLPLGYCFEVGKSLIISIGIVLTNFCLIDLYNLRTN